jgi:peptidoglycan hydrolase-like protein with peptidoglycan-binding domain
MKPLYSSTKKIVSSAALLAVVGLTLPALPSAVIGPTFVAQAQTRYRTYTIPSGTLLKVQIDRTISSKNTTVGDTFTATVFEACVVNGITLVPVGSQVEGRITEVTRAERNKAGTIAVEFTRIIFAGGGSVDIRGELASLDPKEKRQIDNEGRARGKSTTKRNIIFIGGGAGVGAAIGAIAGGAKGAGIGAGVGAAAGILGALLSKGNEAEVKTGQKFGLELMQEARVNGADINGTGSGTTQPGNYPPSNTEPGYNADTDEYTDGEIVRRAQTALRDQGLYNGSLNGRINGRTRNALRSFQRQQRLEENGRLDRPTAEALGVLNNGNSGNNGNNGDWGSPNPGGQNTGNPGAGRDYGYDQNAGEYTDPTIIRRAQARLRDLNLFNGEINGYLSDETRTALGRYQRRQNLQVSQLLDRPTAEALGVVY